MGAGRGLDELGRDPQAIVRCGGRSLQHVADSEFASDLAYVDGAALVGKGRVAGDNFQAATTRQGSDDLLRHAVGKVVALGITAHVGEGEHGDRGPSRLPSGSTVL